MSGRDAPDTARNVTYRTRDMLAKRSMGLVGSHVEERLRFPERTRNIMPGLVRIAVVDVGQFLGIADQEKGGSDANYRPCDEASVMAINPDRSKTRTVFLCQRCDGRQLRFIQVVPSDP